MCAQIKIFIAIVSKHSKIFNFTVSLIFFTFFKKAVKTVFVLRFNQFALPILNVRLLRVLNINIHLDAL